MDSAASWTTRLEIIAPLTLFGPLTPLPSLASGDGGLWRAGVQLRLRIASFALAFRAGSRTGAGAGHSDRRKE